MGFDFSAAGRAQTIAGILLEQRRDQIFGLDRNRPIRFAWPFDIVIDNVGKEFFRRFAEKWDAADQKFVENDSG